MSKKKIFWHKALEPDELAEGRVKSVSIGDRNLCLTHFRGRYAALSNACPHQGGPLGEGSIEGKYLRCPWHGWDFEPLTGKPPGGYDDGVPVYPVEERDDGIYVGLTAEETRPRTVSDVMVETMNEWGVTACFGMVGHSNLHVAEAVRRVQEEKKMRYFGIRHEGAASFACSAYGKLTGKPAACLSIAGPGATNLLTGLWDAHVDRAPAIALTGQVATQFLGRHNFQEVPLEKAFGQVAGYSQTVLPDSPHAELMSLACKHAILERGVAHLIFPDEVAGIGSDSSPQSPAGRLPELEISPPETSLSQALKLLRQAKRPLIIAGHGARFQTEAVIELAERLKCPVVTTFKGKGLISDHHPLAGGVLGRSGTPIASWFMNESDLLLVLGASFSNHTGITSKKPTIQVDYDPVALAKFHSVDCLVYGEIGRTVQILLDELQAHASADLTAEVAERWAIWRREKARRREEQGSRGLSSAEIFEVLSQVVPEDAILPVDVGNNTYSFGRYFECRQQSILMSGYLGSIGFAFPAALGAWAATQEDDLHFRGRKVVSISGDGGFGQYAMEFTTAVKYGMNITHVLLNNSELGKISKEQRSGSWPVWETSLQNPVFADFAESCGGLGLRVEKPEELEVKLNKALSAEGTSLVEIVSDPERV